MSYGTGLAAKAVAMSTIGKKRRYARAKRSVCAWLESHVTGDRYSTTTLDVSAEGARFSDVAPLPLNSQLIVDIQTASNSAPFQCKARVCWSERMLDGMYHFGVRFVDLSDSEREELKTLLE